MNVHRNPTKRPHRIILHRSEWCRLKKQADIPEEPSQQENEYIKGLIEKSQAWIKTWPDTVQGCVALRGKKQEKQRAEEIALIKAFSKKKVQPKNTAEVIQNAKQKIFDESCYGRKLISALHESKVQEERDAQVKFIKEIKEKEAEREKKQRKSVSFCTFDLDKNSVAMNDQQKCITIQNSKFNKEMYEKQKEKEAEAKEQEKILELTDTQLMKYLLDREQEAEEKMKLLERQALEQCAAEFKKTKEEREKWEAEYYANIEKYRKEQEELNCKIKQVLQQIHKVQDSAITKSNYELVKKIQDGEKKRYDDFVGKNNKIGEDRATKRERRSNEKKVQDRNKRITTAELNKTLAEYVRSRDCNNKCFCDRQCLITKSGKERDMKKQKGEMKLEYKEPNLPYFGPRNKLVAALRKREKEPSPWTGAKATEVLFMRNADKTLRDCKYKMPTLKVIDEFVNYNGLDATTLPITKTE